MPPFALGLLIGAGGMFVAMVALILFVTRGPNAPDWSDEE